LDHASAPAAIPGTWESAVHPERRFGTLEDGATLGSGGRTTQTETKGAPDSVAHSWQFVTETLAFDGGHQVTAYVPSAPPQAIVFAGDGELIASWGGVLEAADLPSTMIIGAL
jgi:hypothetical protein